MSEQQSLINRISSVDWASYARPPENAADELPATLIALCRNALGKDRGYHRLLYAIGNNHRGTYYPILVPALPIVTAIASLQQLPAGEIALDALLDIYLSFYPEPGYEQITDPSGDAHPVRVLVEEAFQKMRPILSELAGEETDLATLAAELAQEMDSRPGA